MTNSFPRSLRYADAIENICQPLFKNTRIKYFSHCVLNQDDQLSGLSSNPEFTEFYIKKKYYNYDIHTLQNISDSQYVLWDLLELNGQTKALNDDIRHFNTGHTFSIIKQNKHTKECFHFSADIADESINGMYMIYSEFLENFILYYKDKINESKELSRIYDEHLNITQADAGYYLKTPLIIESNNPSLLLTNKFVININQPSLSKREISCLYWLANGKTMDEIAIILNITHRTVKAHIEHTKEKLQCHTLFQLGCAYHQLELWRLIDDVKL